MRRTVLTRRRCGPDEVGHVRRRSGGLLLALLLAAVLPASAQAIVAPAAMATDEPEIVDLGVLPGGTSSFAEAINDQGHVVGSSDVGDTISHAFLWRRGRMIDLGTLGGGPSDSSGATDINNRGQIVGSSTIAVSEGDFTTHAFLWHRGRMIDLGTLGGPQSFATGINDRGDVVGYSSPAGEPAGGNVHAFLWRDGRMIDLGLVEGETITNAEAVNNRGQVVANGNGSEGLGSFVWWRGVRSPLALTPEADGASAHDINDRSVVVGYVLVPGVPDINRAVVWREGVAAELGVADPYGSHAYGVNDRGQIVGTGITTGAFIWERGVVSSLPSLIGEGGTSANDINERGQAAGYSATAEGISPRYHAVLWR